MSDAVQPNYDDFDPNTPTIRKSPQHGERGRSVSISELPLSLTIAISREAGSRGGTIAERAGELLNWQVYRQETMEFMAQEGLVRQDLMTHLSPAAKKWVDDRLDALMREQNVSTNPSVLEMAKLILSLSVQGDVVLLGRGAGFVLPPASTLHVRLIAPLRQRIAYLSQWMRLTKEEATEEVRKRDERRSEFIATHFHRQPADIYQYDIVLNSSRLGEERCADMIAHAARAKLAAIKSQPDSAT